MRLQLISDLHTEFYPNPVTVLDKAEIALNLDFLVVAGDLVVPSRQSVEQVEAAFNYVSSKARHVVYVDGNHEFYGGDKGSVDAKLSAVLSKHKNVHWLQNSGVVLEGVHFFGGAMWFDNHDQMNFYYKRFMNDFSQILGLENWVYQRNEGFAILGNEAITRDTIVVTHHLPHAKSTPPQYGNSPVNRFFVSDQSALITKAQPRLWLHGHTHSSCDYTLGETRVVCNPYGYPNENAAYPQVVIEV